MRSSRKNLLAVLFFVLSSYAFSQQVIEGRIVDKETRKPVPFASIGIVGTAKGTSSNADGQFSLQVAGIVTLKITCVGYESRTLEWHPEHGIIELRPVATQLKELVVFDRDVNAKKVVSRAFAATSTNFARTSFFQSFFYRHYCRDEETYGRLIEAFVDVWKQNGYRAFRSKAGQREGLRVTQIRRSLDHTSVAQGHEPIAVANALLADVAAYQTAEESEVLNFYEGLSNLRTNGEDYQFFFQGITSYDGAEVYEITYKYLRDSVHNSSPGPRMAGAKGTLYITTDSYAIVRSDEIRYKGYDTVRTSAYYRKYDDRYYPYHLMRDGGSYSDGKQVHWFHIDLMSVEISEDPFKAFAGDLPNKDQLLSIPYDSAYWTQQTILKATPLETEIIQDLGGGRSLLQQFSLYQQFELNSRNGGVDGAQKLKWLADFCKKDEKPMVVCYWHSNTSSSVLLQLEQFKQLNKKYRNHAVFAMVSLDDDQKRWEELVTKYQLSIDGLLQYRVGSAQNPEGELPRFEINDASGNLVPLKENSISALERELAEAIK